MESQVPTWSMRLKVPLTRGVGNRNRLPVSPTAPAGTVLLPAVVSAKRGRLDCRVRCAGRELLVVGSDEGLGG